MSRSGSAKGSRKGSAKKKTPKQQIKELTEQNSLLMSELDLMKANQTLITEKLVDITKKITQGVDHKKYGITDNTDFYQISTQVCSYLMNRSNNNPLHKHSLGSSSFLDNIGYGVQYDCEEKNVRYVSGGESR